MNSPSSQVRAALDALQRNDLDEASGPAVVYLMRGLPSSGKSHRARELAGSSGVVCETDAFLRVPHAPSGSLALARAANFQSFCMHMEERVSPIVVDRGNGLNEETYLYVNHAVAHGYEVKLIEPRSAWWREIQTLLRYRPLTNELLHCWAEELARINQATNQVSLETIVDWLDGWVADLSCDELLHHAAEHKRECSTSLSR